MMADCMAQQGDRVLIQDMQLDTLVGVYPEERQALQPLIFDIELGTDFTAAFACDDVSRTLDYAAVKAQVERLCEQNHFDLLESLAGYLLTNLFTLFPADWIGLKIRKPRALQGAMAGIATFRTREQMGLPFSPDADPLQSL